MNYKLGTDIIFGFNLSIVPIATVLNGLTCVVCLRKNLRSIPTFIFCAVIAVVETIPLLNRFLDSSFQYFTGFFLRDNNDVHCKMTLFFHFFPLQTSAWLLIAMCAERYLSIKITIWRKSLFNGKRAAITAGAVVALFIAINFCLFFSPYLAPKAIPNTNSTKTICADGPLATPFNTINLYLYSMIPFGILLIFNGLFVYEILFKKKKNLERSEKDQAKRRSLSMSVMALTLKYVIMTGPAVILAGYFATSVPLLPFGNILFNTFSTFRFMNHCVGFFVLLATNKKFTEEVRDMFGIKAARKKKTFETSNVTASTNVAKKTTV